MRYFNVFGLNQDPTFQYSAVIPKFIKFMKEDIAPTIYADGTQSRDFTYVANVVEANLLACEIDKAVGEVFNIACGKRYTILQLVSTINKIVGKNIKPIFDEEKVGEVKHSLADIEKAKKMLGFKVICGFEEGLENLVREVNK